MSLPVGELFDLLEVSVLDVVGLVAASLLATGLLLTTLVGVTTWLACLSLLVHLL